MFSLIKNKNKIELNLKNLKYILIFISSKMKIRKNKKSS